MAWTADKPSIRSTLVTKVLRKYGIDTANDTELAAIALDFLDEAVIDMNTRLYEFNKIVNTTITLVNAQVEYDLPSTPDQTSEFYRESLAYLVRTDGSSKKSVPLTYLPYVRFREMYGATEQVAATGLPEVYTLRNVHNDGKVSLGPAPDGGIAAGFTLTVEYYRRIPLVSSVITSASIDVPQEVETPLLYAAMKRMAIHLLGPGHPDVGGFEALERKAISDLVGIDKRHPDEDKRFRLAGEGRSSITASRGFYVRLD